MNTFYKTLICLFFFLNFTIGFSQETSATHDSIVSWIEKAKDKELPLDERKVWINKAEIKIDRVENDSLRNKILLKISLQYRKINDFVNFRLYNNRALKLSIKLGDSFNIAKTYNRLAYMYINNDLNDSAYHYYSKAKNIYKAIGNSFYTGRMLYNMAVAQRNIKDYVGSDITTNKAIKIFKSQNRYDKLYLCYNNLGIIFNNLGNFDQAILYHYTALDYLRKKKEKNILKATTLNNIGVVFEKKKRYEEAINCYLEALSFESVFYKNPKQYSMLLDNLAYSKLKLNNYSKLPELFYKALKIRDSIQHIDGIIINKIHLAEYYLDQNDTLKSYQFIREANTLSILKKAPAHLLQTYDLLAKVDPKNSTKYLRRYIEISDSTLLEERRMHDKFTRIEYETDELEEQFNTVKSEAEQLEEEAAKYKRRNQRVYQILWWIGGSIVLVSIVLTIRYYQRQLQNKYEKVVLQQQLLRSQMNPHFLFNTLNTILHTTDTKPEKTKQYVLKLSQLLRTTLENSREEFVPLQDEIEAIDNYLNLQSNFSEKFDFKLTIADKLETEFTYVPPMLIQPFVENAIIHGIMNTKTRGLISLDFSLKSKELVSCTITDNGIGYSKNSQEEKSNLKTHTSISGDIVKERLAIYNKQNKTNASLHIEDIADVNGNTTGTKVTLNLPSYEI